MIVKIEVASQADLPGKSLKKSRGQLTDGAMSANELLDPAEEQFEHDLRGPRGLVEVDGAVHVEAGEEVRLGRRQALAGQVEALAGRVGAQLRQHPGEVEVAVVGAGGVAVAEQVVAAVGVELPGDDLGE